MSFRHPPRLNDSGEEEPRIILDLADIDDTPAALTRLERRAASFAKASKFKKDSPAQTEARPVPPPFATDFGPTALIEYLRAEVDKLKRERNATSGKGKGKEKEILEPAISGVLHQSHTPTSPHGLLPPSTTPALADRVNDRQSAVGLATRRSQRLARRGSLNREASQGAGDCKKTPLSRPPLLTPFLPDLSQQPSFQEGGSSSQAHDLTSLPSGTGPSRASTFEAHTKNKRMAVRNTAQEDLISPLRARLRQRRYSRDLFPSGGSAAMSTDLSAMSGAYYLEFRQQDVREARYFSLPESFLNGEARSPATTPGQETTSSKTIQAPFDKLMHGLPNGKASTQNPPTTTDFAYPGWESQSPPVTSFDYATLIPEVIPLSDKKEFIDQAMRANRNSSADSENRSPESSWVYRIPYYGAIAMRREVPSMRALAPAIPTVDGSDSSAEDVPILSPDKKYPRLWKPPSMIPGMSPASTSLTMVCSGQAVKGLEAESNSIQKFDADIWTEISRFLSTQDVRNLRLVDKSLAHIIAPIQFRNVVVNFDRHFFDASRSNWDIKSGLPPNDSMFRKYGANINKFGISFEYDLQGLSHAKAKTIEKEHDAWFGTFIWPTEQYPRFPELQALEDFVDNNRPLLKEAFKSLTTVSELGLCIDSGHGWLEGPDISDMALFNRRTTKGSKVFGKTFKTEDVWVTFARNEYFRWAQQNTINETLKALMTKQPTPESAVKEVRFLNGLKIRDIESFRYQDEQYDYDPECHVGGGPVPGAEALVDANGEFPNLSQAHQVAGQRRLIAHARNGGKRLPQWPLIFSGHNLAAEHGGHCSSIQNKTANFVASPLLPGALTEPQAQWLMETVWAQRAFLSAYTTAIITNKQNFASIHTLRISKLSSGLLPSIEQGEFWKSLPGLKTLEILISPDWRKEHVLGDRRYAERMLILPDTAAQRFTNFLRKYIVNIETLHSLSIGYVGGGEHAVGMFARNKHVLPAPIVDWPGDWLHDNTRKRRPFLIKFDHIRHLKFQNCWFTPWMLQEFMKKSRDTSLHSLNLDSVSMTVYHDADIERPTWNVLGHLRCLHPRQDWTQEILPTGASWARVLDAITPGKTLFAHKYDAGLIDPEAEPIPEPAFRGHIQEIVLNSCGYVKISVPKWASLDYDQNAAVLCAEPTMDDGLHVRKTRFALGVEVESVLGAFRNPAHRPPEPSEDTKVMMSDSGDDYPWLGTLTQCIHPIEKRVLEEAWQMTFGWPNNLERFAAVEDGQCEGGTGRFSGVIRKNDGNT
ncbi:uncharacterized protein Z520_11525 [Fonsecaea multimorphosa CBS 102226]|uniref:F-box domain-containing protein n=1 Tax=Fonsecaea multimorphosa CBS 102226 TaxID=1442371 RepID=A0A0D2K8J7_9EURO|nr:uncharacterized protein Z520_11525 [Fonsecaea multimorphosa CBS 102226]KIX92673.1 hypothetical protein Z520_11525 [Fonsecaea multimorphosa CBS 102226]OAL18004.1 hypothetical protein AYO22_11072 [Fonsecaea multimorphosa]